MKNFTTFENLENPDYIDESDKYTYSNEEQAYPPHSGTSTEESDFNVDEVITTYMPEVRSRKEWYSTTDPDLRRHITGRREMHYFGKGAPSFSRATREYRHLSKEFSRKALSDQQMSKKWDDFNGIDFNLIDLAQKNASQNYDATVKKYQEGEISNRRMRKYNDRYARTLSNLSDNYDALYRTWANKNGVPLVRTQSSVSPLPFVMGTVGLPLLIAGGASAAPYIGTVLSNPLVQGYLGYQSGKHILSDNGVKKTYNHFKNGEYGKGMISLAGDLLDVTGVAAGVNGVYRTGKAIVNGMDSAIQTARNTQILNAAQTTPKPAIAQVVKAPKNPYLSGGNAGADLIYGVESPAAALPSIQNKTLKPMTVTMDMMDPANTTRPLVINPKYKSSFSNQGTYYGPIIDPVDSSIAPNARRTQEWLDFVRTNRVAEDFPGLVDPAESRIMYTKWGLDPDMITDQDVTDAANIAFKSAKEAMGTVPEGAIITPALGEYGLLYYRNGISPNTPHGATGAILTKLQSYSSPSPSGLSDTLKQPHQFTAQNIDMIKNLNPQRERNVSQSLYNAALQYGNSRYKSIVSNYKGLVSGEHLLSPELTVKVWKHFPETQTMGFSGIHKMGNGLEVTSPTNALSKTFTPKKVLQRRFGQWEYTPQYDNYAGKEVLITHPTKTIPIKVGSLLHPDRIISIGNGRFSLKPLDMNSKDLYKSIAPVVGTGTGLYFISGNNK